MTTSQSSNLVQATIQLPFILADEVSDFLLELGALSVSLEDAQAQTDQEVALFGEPGLEPDSAAWNENVVVTLFRNQSEAEQIFSELPEGLLNGQKPAFETVAHKDWVRETQAQFEPIAITDTFYIVPTWHQPQNTNNRINLTLDPGLAFGTGSHPTTALCLKWLCSNPPRDQEVLDYGCGSGILAIGALKLGARKVVAIDIDSQAVTSTQDNAKQNDVHLEVGQPSFLKNDQQFNLVIANILSNPLKLLAPALCQHILANGNLILSGVLSRQADEVMHHYKPWVDISVWKEQDGWVCLHGKKKDENT